MPASSDSQTNRLRSSKNELAGQSGQLVPPEMSADGLVQVGRLRDRDLFTLEKIALGSRVIIVEGISGSGKDAFQAYLKKKLKTRDVYDFSEGDVLHSWKQLQIEGIGEVRVKLMRLFVNYMRDLISRDDNSVFLLNRFHLSTYASTVIQQPKLESEYSEIIDVLKLLPVHVFILQLDVNEIERRSSHPERSGAWRKFQQRIVENGTFRDRLETQQRTILEAADRQKIPYTVMRLGQELKIGDGQARILLPLSIVRHVAQTSVGSPKAPRKRRAVPEVIHD